MNKLTATHPEDVTTAPSKVLLFTRKAVAIIDLLPTLLPGIPEGHLQVVEAALEPVLDAAFSCESRAIVDACREAAREVLSEWLRTLPRPADSNDLGDLIKQIPVEHAGICASAKLLHCLRLLRQVRPLTVEDATLAISSLGFMLREMRWAA